MCASHRDSVLRCRKMRQSQPPAYHVNPIADQPSESDSEHGAAEATPAIVGASAANGSLPPQVASPPQLRLASDLKRRASSMYPRSVATVNISALPFGTHLQRAFRNMVTSQYRTPVKGTGVISDPYRGPSTLYHFGDVDSRYGRSAGSNLPRSLSVIGGTALQVADPFVRWSREWG